MYPNPSRRHPGMRVIALFLTSFWACTLLADNHEPPAELIDEEELLEELEEAQPEGETPPPLGPDGNKRGGTGHGGECPKPCTVPVF